MKKIDLHIHTIATISDSAFVFSLETFSEYVKTSCLDAVAVTNHNVFDAAQFKAIYEALGIVVFPGIEIDVGNGHVLIISQSTDCDDFAIKAGLVAQKIKKQGDSMSIDELQEIYGDLSRYLVIPHTDKAPSMDASTLTYLMGFSSAGEVDSEKKFIRALKNDDKPTPVLFSDARMRVGMSRFPSRQTFVDCGAVTLASLKACLRDKGKVAISRSDGNSLWQVFANGPKLSTGLNVLVGGRSTGKTRTLDEIYEVYGDSAKYIRQFSLVQQNEEAYEREFTGSVERRRSNLLDVHLQGLKRVLDDVTKVDLADNDKAVQRYVDTLLRSAEEVGRRDAFSKAVLFDEQDFSVGSTDKLTQLIESVRHVIENQEFKSIIEKHVDLNSMRRLIVELIAELWTAAIDIKKKNFVNGVVRGVKKALQVHTAAVPVEDVDLYQISLDTKRVERFSEIVDVLKTEAVIFTEDIQGFRIEARREAYTGAMDVRRASNRTLAFGDAFSRYARPYEYLRGLLKIEGLPRADLYKLFVKISCRILNRDGYEVSGGERSEFRLLQEISDAQKFDVLLIDEPESSFDNIFLKSDVNKLIKAISGSMPVVVVTHNNTVGASIGADYVLHTAKDIENGKVAYRIYCGHPGDHELVSADGKKIRTHDVLLDSLEGGIVAYEGRRISYEAINN